MTTGPPLVHLGYHKTGTSWLQQEVFPRLAEVTLVPADEAIAELVEPDPLDRAVPTALAAWRARLDALPGRLLVSAERLSGHPDSRGFDRVVIAERVHTAFPDARVLLVIRRQADAIRSAYSEYVRSGGAETLGRYLRPPYASHRVPHFDADFYAYDRHIADLVDRFGTDAVTVLAFEQLVRDPEGFAADVAAWAGVDPPRDVPTGAANPSLAPLTLACLRTANLVLRAPSNPAAPIDRPGLGHRLARAANRADRRLPAKLRRVGEVRLTRRITAAVAGRYGASNRATAALTGLDLAALGYDV